jgi:SAM-dependent methyltransferase
VRVARRRPGQRGACAPFAEPRRTAAGNPVAGPSTRPDDDDVVEEPMVKGPVIDESVADVAAHYSQGLEASRLDEPLGVVEFTRTVEIISRVLPDTRHVVADVGGGPGRYSFWLADLGHRVIHRDVFPLHVEQVAAARHPRVETAVADARDLDLDDATVDAVLLLGPLYHLYERHQRVAVLREARRIARPGAPILVSAVSRWAPRLHGHLCVQLYRRFPAMADVVVRVEADGRLLPLSEGSFTAYCHTPAELRSEAEAAGLTVEDLVGVEGLAFALSNLAERLADPVDREVVLDSARAIERVPELLGLGPHLLLTARVPS